MALARLYKSRIYHYINDNVTACGVRLSGKRLIDYADQDIIANPEYRGCHKCASKAPITLTGPSVLRVPVNNGGRDIIVGDVHGMHDDLLRLLDKCGFDEGCDRVFLLGDMVDRGPQSAAVLALVDQKRFFAIRGNHETIALEGLLAADKLSAGSKDVRAIIKFLFWLQLGGGWENAPLTASEVITRLMALPYAIEIARPEQAPLGLVHADLPRNWAESMKRLAQQDIVEQEYLLWGRYSAQQVKGGQKNSGHKECVSCLFTGHNIFPMPPFISGNHCFLDTGAFVANDQYGLSAAVVMPSGGIKLVSQKTKGIDALPAQAILSSLQDKAA